MRRLITCLLAAAALAGAATQVSPSPAFAGTVCQNVHPRQSFSRTVSAHGKPIARVWMHFTTDGRSCTVLRALKWKGTPHYMFLRVCKTRDRPNHGVGCSGFDAGQYRYYAGPIYHPQLYCQQIKVKVDSPSGHRVVDTWVAGPCD